MNTNLNQLANKGLEKLALENTAFNNCKDDMSDVHFEIGKSSYTAKIFGAIVLFALFFGGRMLLKKRFAGSSDMASSIGDIIFWCFIGLIAILVVVTFIREKSKPTISVSGKNVYFGAKCVSSDEIQYVKCSKWFQHVEVYSKGKKVLSFPWELDNSELFIAWVKKCGIVFMDNRMRLS